MIVTIASFKVASLTGASFLGLGLLLSAGTSSPAGANPPARVLGTPSRRAASTARQPADLRRHRAYAVAPTGCSSNNANPENFFVGVSGGTDYAGGFDSGVLGGASNEACGSYAAIAGGTNNIADALYSFVGGGGGNVVEDDYSAVSGGYENEASGEAAFVGSGWYGLAGATGSFVGAGGTEYYNNVPGAAAGGGNIAGGADSFVGAGDLNQISSNGSGSFIGGGGYQDASFGDTVGNRITAVDGFIGAGDDNNVGGTDAFVGAGSQNHGNGANSFIGAGYENDTMGSQSGVGSGDFNTVSGAGSFIGGGGTISDGASENQISGADSFLGAGDQNTVAGNEAFLGGGQGNTIAKGATEGAIGGGYGNYVSAQKATIGGGESNEAEGSFAVVPGGYHDEALGNESFAAGSQAEAKYTGSFVWSDYVSGESVLNDSANDEFVARASGGVYFFSNAGKTSGVHLAAGSGTWSSLSDRNAKTDVVPLDDASILSKVASLPISAWRYKTESGVRHVGPMAQDFYAAFGVGEDDRHITSIDEDGVALAAIKALHDENARLRVAAEAERAEKDGEVARLQARLDTIDARDAALEKRLDALATTRRPSP